MPPQDPKRVLKDIGRKIAELRGAADVTQEALAEILGWSLKYQQRVEGGRENLTTGTLVKIANALGVPVAHLFRAPRSRQVRPGRPPKRPPRSRKLARSSP